MQPDNLCVKDESYEDTLKHIGKKHYTLWNHKGTLKYIGKKNYTLWNIKKYKDNRNNIFRNHALKYIPLNCHQTPSSHLILPFLCLWAIWNSTWIEVVTWPIHIDWWRQNTLYSYRICWRCNFPCQGRWLERIGGWSLPTLPWSLPWCTGLS